MRVAIFHDYLNQFGGAERVLQALLEIFPDADLYTLLYDKEKTFGLFEKNIKKTSFLDYPIVRKKHRAFIPLMPLAAAKIRIDGDYNLIISSTAGYAKGFNYRHQNDENNPYHISYCHSPLRYAWEIDYLKNLPVSPWPIAHQTFSHPIAEWLKKWDKKASKKVNLFIANSEFIAEKIKAYYEREAIVINPPVDFETFYPEPKIGESDYFLMTGRLLYYKSFDLGIEAFNQLKKPLKIIGAGPEFKKLKSLVASPLIEFIPPVADKDLRFFYSNAKALIFPQIEDFGLVAAEAQACGTPVIAFGKGGAAEIIENKKTGLFFNEQTPQAIINAVKEFEKMNFDRQYIRKTAERFSKAQFKDKIKEMVAQSGFKI